MSASFGKRQTIKVGAIKEQQPSEGVADTEVVKRRSASVSAIFAVAILIGFGAIELKRQLNIARARHDVAVAMKELGHAEANLPRSLRHNGEVPKVSSSGSAPPLTGAVAPVTNVVTFCREKWPHDFNMRDYCEKQQRSAEGEVSKRDIDPQIGRICTKKWPEDWNMYLYCVKQQTTASTPADARPTEPVVKIEDYCRREWGAKYSMVENCETRQREARSEMYGRDVDEEIARGCAADWQDNWVMFKNCVDREADAKVRR